MKAKSAKNLFIFIESAGVKKNVYIDNLYIVMQAYVLY